MKNRINEDEFVDSLRGCARCGDDHENLVWKKFKHPIYEHDDWCLWTHWAICPFSNEPILLTFDR